jgi:hypothetical protein
MSTVLLAKKQVKGFFPFKLHIRQSCILAENRRLRAGLPDGLFPYQKYQFWRALARKILVYFGPWDIFRRLVNFKAIRYILWSAGIFFPDLVSCDKKYLATPAPRISFTTQGEDFT